MNTVIPETVISIEDGAFYGCSGLESIIIPESVSNIGGYAFTGCFYLLSVENLKSVKVIGEYAFSGCSELTTITIPKTADSIGNCVFSGCISLKKVYVLAPNPPVFHGGEIPEESILYVPLGCSGIYSEAEGWKDFSMILETNTTSTGDMKLSHDSVPVWYYDMKGSRFEQPQSGLNIIMFDDGTSRKIYLE